MPDLPPTDSPAGLSAEDLHLRALMDAALASHPRADEILELLRNGWALYLRPTPDVVELFVAPIPVPGVDRSDEQIAVARFPRSLLRPQHSEAN